MPTEPEPLTLFRIVQRAVEVVDPDGIDADVGDFLLRFEDADEPVGGVPGETEQRLAEGAGALDPEQENPALQMAVAVATYLVYRRDEIDEDPDKLLRLAARAEYEGDPPAHVAEWLSDAGVEV
jgi:hypothetical protein